MNPNFHVSAGFIVLEVLDPTLAAASRLHGLSSRHRRSLRVQFAFRHRREPLSKGPPAAWPCGAAAAMIMIDELLFEYFVSSRSTVCAKRHLTYGHLAFQNYYGALPRGPINIFSGVKTGVCYYKQNQNHKIQSCRPKTHVLKCGFVCPKYARTHQGASTD